MFIITKIIMIKICRFSFQFLFRIIFARFNSNYVHWFKRIYLNYNRNNIKEPSFLYVIIIHGSVFVWFKHLIFLLHSSFNRSAYFFSIQRYRICFLWISYIERNFLKWGVFSEFGRKLYLRIKTTIVCYTIIKFREYTQYAFCIKYVIKWILYVSHRMQSNCKWRKYLE